MQRWKKKDFLRFLNKRKLFLLEKDSYLGYIEHLEVKIGEKGYK